MNLASLEEITLSYYNAKVQVWEHLKERIRLAQAVRREERDAIRTPEALQRYIEEFRRAFLHDIGGLPGEIGVPPPSTLAGEIKGDGFTIGKMILEPRPGVHATCNLYLPAGTGGKGPAILFLCGHSAEAKAGTRYQILCQMLVRRGFVVLALDPLGQGERLSYYDAARKETRVRCGTGEHEYCGLQCTLRGKNLSRYMLHDAIRAVDFLSHHPCVDSARIGITGSSGGGTQTSLMMLVEPRLAAAAPTTSITSRLAIFDSGFGQDAEQIWPGFSRRGYDHSDLLAAFAPRPLSVQSATYDFFPIEGTRAVVREARRFWELLGCSGNFQAVEDKSIHRYTDALGLAACDFFSRHLGPLQEPLPSPNAAPEPLPVAELDCTRTGQILGDFPETKTVFIENRDSFLADREKRPPQIGRAVEFLREAVFRDRQPCDLNLRITGDKGHGEFRCRSGFWWSQPGLINSGLILLPWTSGRGFPVTIAIWEGGTQQLRRHDAWIRREIRGGRAVFVPNLTGMGPLDPHPFNQSPDERTTTFRICDDLLTLGDSYAALRVHDLLRCAEGLGDWGADLDTGDVSLYGEGPCGIYAALASALDGRFGKVRWDNPMPSYSEILLSQYYCDRDIKTWIIPGLIAYADWPDLIGSPLS